MPTISLKGVSKRYKIYPRQGDRLKELLSFGRADLGHEFWALKDIDLDLEPGTALGVLGRNGAGKSTLLKIVSGVLEPTSGTVEVNGRLAALLQLGAGFNPEFTGRENVLLNGLILGLDRREILERFDEIAAFADIGEFMDQAVKTYSSGMRARLGFAVAVNVDPDVLVVDETLSVGDAVFKQMGMKKMYDLRDSGTTVLFVSHSPGMVKNFCSEAMLLHKGNLVYHGETSEAADRYRALLSSIERQKNQQQAGDIQLLDQDLDTDDEDGLENPTFRKDPGLERRAASFRRSTTGEAKISSVELLDEYLRPVDTVASGSPVTVRVHLEYLEAVERSKLVITLRNNAGLDVFSTNTTVEGVPLKKMEKGERVIVDFAFEIFLSQGPYSVTAAVGHVESKNLYLDWVDVAKAFEITRPPNRGGIRGLVYLPTEVKIRALGEGRQDRSA